MVTASHVIGMIGIGQLGLPIATNLMRAGFNVVGYRRSDREEFIRRGGVALDTSSEVAREADVLLLCLPSEGALTETLEGPNGILNALKPGQIVVELGTYAKAFKIAQAEKIASRGGRPLEAEVSGSPPMVTEHKAALYVGGDYALYEECKAIFDAIAGSHFHLGDYGSAVAMKLIANYLLTIHTLAAAEAINLGVKAGFNANRITEVIKQGAGNSTMFSIRGPMMAARAFKPAPGPFNTLEKYIRLGEQFSKEMGCASPLFSAAVPYFLRALEKGMGEEDIAAVIKLIEEESARSIEREDK